MRSSTWKIVTFSHGIRPYSAANIAPGVLPPETASVNLSALGDRLRGGAGDDLGSALGGGLGVRKDLDVEGHHAGLLVVAAELLAHRGQQPVLEVVQPARREPRVQRCREDRRRHSCLDRGDRRPATLARVGDAPGELLELRATP